MHEDTTKNPKRSYNNSMFESATMENDYNRNFVVLAMPEN
jgi:hypothetical protein